MARYNEILVGRYNRFAQKLFSMKGEANLPTLNPDLALMLALFHGAENRYLEGWDLGSSQSVCTPGAGNVSQSVFRNPAGSNTAMVVVRIWFSIGAAADGFTLYNNRSVTSTVDQNTAGNTSTWDNRGRPVLSAVVTGNNAQAPTGGAGFNVVMGFNNSPALGNDDMFRGASPIEIPVMPGGCLRMTGNVANNNDNIYWFWRERLLEDSERA